MRETMRLIFDPKNIWHKTPFGAVACGTEVTFRLRADGQNEPGNLCCRMLLEEDGQSPSVLTGKEAENQSFVFTWTAEKTGLYFYRFQLLKDDRVIEETTVHQITVYEKEFQTPVWMKEGLMYQIFPDRFCRSRSYVPPEQKKNYKFHEVWGEAPDQGPDEDGIVWNRDFFGGNLKGIEEQLPYLQDLGVTVIYLNPVFRAFSNHRYDTANYMEIDPLLGTTDDFVSLCESARQKGIRIIIDGVFNHTGSHSIYFNKDGFFDEIGACQSPESKYYRWYSFEEYPSRYESWWGIDTLPSVNEMEESYRDYIIRNEDSVIKHWMKKGASGVRLDVADELPDAFIAEIRQAVKSMDQDGALIGEVWEDASNKIAYGERRKYFQGKELDSVMNYPLKDALISFLCERSSGQELQNAIMDLKEHYPKMCFSAMMNILGTHDTERIRTVFSSAFGKEKGRQRLFCALLVWAFVPGIPCIYYGDELGMEGGKDPDNRRCFQKEKADNEIFSFYMRLLKFRKSIFDLAEMEYIPAPSGHHDFSFERRGENGRLMVCLNTSDTPKYLDPGITPNEKLLDFFHCGNVCLLGENKVEIEGESGIVLWIVKK